MYEARTQAGGQRGVRPPQPSALRMSAGRRGQGPPRWSETHEHGRTDSGTGTAVSGRPGGTGVNARLWMEAVGGRGWVRRTGVHVHTRWEASKSTKRVRECKTSQDAAGGGHAGQAEETHAEPKDTDGTAPETASSAPLSPGPSARQGTLNAASQEPALHVLAVNQTPHQK